MSGPLLVAVIVNVPVCPTFSGLLVAVLVMVMLPSLV